MKIQAHSQIEWHYVPTSQNPADLGSRGGQPTQQWLNGPTWLGNETKWPESPNLHASSESPKRDEYVNLLEKHNLTRTLRIGAWVKRFIHNCQNERDNRIGGPLRYDEILKEEMWWVAKVQKLIRENERNARILTCKQMRADC